MTDKLNPIIPVIIAVIGVQVCVRVLFWMLSNGAFGYIGGPDPFLLGFFAITMPIHLLAVVMAAVMIIRLLAYRTKSQSMNFDKEMHGSLTRVFAVLFGTAYFVVMIHDVGWIILIMT